METGLFLNASIPSFAIERLRKSKEISCDKEFFEVIHRGLKYADFDGRVIKELDERYKLAGNDKARNKSIPVGIMAVSGNVLSAGDIKENLEHKRNGKSIEKKYEKLNFYMATCLQDEIFNSEVTFEIDSRYLITNKPGSIKTLYVNFNDGTGYLKYDFRDKISIPYKFNAAGEKLITLKFETEDGIFTSHLPLKVIQLEPTKFFSEFTIEAPAERIDGDKKGRPSEAFTSGLANIRLGCDNVFDKPVIIVEGFDPNNDRRIVDFAPSYEAHLNFLLRNGYDFVYLDFYNNADFIQNNAAVLINLIKQVNLTKSGNHQLIVIGESMGGLIARYAIRRMEQLGQNHNVSHYISYDSPQRGANVPIGLQALFADLKDTPVGIVAQYFLGKWRNYIDADELPASKQMLMHYRGTNPHPEYTSFYNELSGMGYPQNCRNVAITHGDSDGEGQIKFNGQFYNFGDHIFRANGTVGNWTWNLEANTNVPGVNTKLSELVFVTLPYSPPLYNPIPIPTIKVRNFNMGINHDIIPGGNFGADLSFYSWLESSYFSFIPTFSAIDFQGNVNIQNNLNINIPNSLNQTPFDAVYSRNFNSMHVIRMDLTTFSWETLFLDELGINTNNWGCNTNPIPPPTPYFNGTNYIPCSGYTYALANTPLGAVNTHWVVQPGNHTFYGNSFYLDASYFNLSPPVTITCYTNYANNNAVATWSNVAMGVCDQGVSNPPPSPPAPPGLTVSNIHISADCDAPDNRKTVSWTVGGGSGNYEWSIDSQHWYPGTGVWLDPNQFYYITARDVNNHSQTVMFTLNLNGCGQNGSSSSNNPPPSPPSSLTVSDINVSVACDAPNNQKTVTWTISGGNGAYEWSLDGQNWYQGTGAWLVPNQTYSIMVRDVNDHNKTGSFTVSLQDCGQGGSSSTPNNPPPPSSSTLIVSDITVSSECNAPNNQKTVVWSISGGSGSYEWSIDGQNWFQGTAAWLPPSQTFNITVRDMADHSKTSSFSVNTNDCNQGGSSSGPSNPPSGGLVLYNIYIAVACDAPDNRKTVSWDVSGGSGNYQWTLDGQNWYPGTVAWLGPGYSGTLTIRDQYDHNKTASFYANTNGCGQSGSFTNNNARVGVRQLQHTEPQNQVILIYPNPASELLYISVRDNNVHIQQVNLLDVQGRVVKQSDFSRENTAGIDISDLQGGVYYVVLTTDRYTETKKIIKR